VSKPREEHSLDSWIYSAMLAAFSLRFAAFVEILAGSPKAMGLFLVHRRQMMRTNTSKQGY